MQVGAADGDEEGIKVSRCSVASGAASCKKGRGEGGCWGSRKGIPGALHPPSLWKTVQT